MSKCRSRSCPRLFAMLGQLCLAGLAAAAEIQLATDAPGPLTPEESQKLFQLPPGLRVELVAAEPLVADPVAMAFDARGRILVCEIHGYNLEGYLDVLELNKTGVLDRQCAGSPPIPMRSSRAEQEQYGTVKRLEDTDGDGRVDRSHVLGGPTAAVLRRGAGTRRRDCAVRRTSSSWRIATTTARPRCGKCCSPALGCTTSGRGSTIRGGASTTGSMRPAA